MESFIAGVCCTLVAIAAVVLLLMLPCGRGFGKGGTFSLDERVILVTGAASGIGFKLCETVARQHKNCRIYMVDRNEDNLRDASRFIDQVATRAQTNTVSIAKLCDIGQLDAWDSTLNQIYQTEHSAGRYVSVLVNNAAIVHGKAWEALSAEEMASALHIGSVAHFQGLKTFLPSMVDKNDGMIVTMSSIMGMLPGCKLADYCSSKYATLGLHEAMALEVSCRPGNKVHFLAVCPYVVDTGMFQGAFESSSLWLTRFFFPTLNTETVVRRMLLAMQRREFMLVMPWILSLAPYIIRVLPIPFWQSCLKFMGAEHGMDTFVGKKTSG